MARRSFHTNICSWSLSGGINEEQRKVVKTKVKEAGGIMGRRIQKVERESVTEEKWLVHRKKKERDGERNNVKESEQPS